MVPPKNDSYHSLCLLLVPPGLLPVPILTNMPISLPGHSFTAASSRICGEGLYLPAPSSVNIEFPTAMGLNAKPVAQVARPACQMVQLNSGGGSFRESYDRRRIEWPFLGVPLKTAVTALSAQSQQMMTRSRASYSRLGAVFSPVVQ